MQDKNTSSSREQLAELGWQRMAALLDAEIPVVPAGKHRRGVLWFWLLGMAFVLGAGAWALQYRHNSPPPAQPMQTPPAPMRADKGPAPAAGQVASALSEGKAPSTDRRKEQRGAEMFTSASELQVVYNQLPGSGAAVSEAAASAAPEIAFQELPAPARPEVLPEIEWMRPRPVLAAAALPTLPTLPLAALSPSQDVPQWAEAPKRRSPRKFRFGAEVVAGIVAPSGGTRLDAAAPRQQNFASRSANSSNALSSFAAGPVVEWRVSPLFKLQSGLLAGSAMYDLALGGSVSMVDLAGSVDPANNSALHAVANAVSSGYNWSVRMNSVQMPLMASYRITPRLWAEAGLTPARAWASGDGSVSGAAESLSDPSGINQTFAYDPATLERAVIASTGQWELTASAGLQYRLTPHLSLRLQYQHGINDLVEDQYLQAKQRNLRMSGLAYF